MSSLRGELRREEPMARHTVWGIGGPARQLYTPTDKEDLCAFLMELAPEEEILWLGLGSNLLVRDGGFAGTVILTSPGLSQLERIEPDGVRAQAGVACPKVAKFSAAAGLSGCEFFAGIPGTVGGALAMNAGAFGGETWDIVESVETVDRSGRLRRRAAEEFDAGYRRVGVPWCSSEFQTPGVFMRSGAEEAFIGTTLRLHEGHGDGDSHRDGESGDVESGQAKIKALLAKRSATQPLGERSCGSVFRNPEGDHAARLIEVSGLKGKRVGGARVSAKHANFIINEGHARAADVEALMATIVERVERDSGVRLIAEVKVIGEP